MTPQNTHSGSAETATINNFELTSIKALLAYTAHDKRVSEAVVRDVFSSRFGIDDVEKLPRDAYDDAIRFLVDIQIQMQ
jgi:hypothetical protein